MWVCVVFVGWGRGGRGVLFTFPLPHDALSLSGFMPIWMKSKLGGKPRALGLSASGEGAGMSLRRLGYFGLFSKFEGHE